MTSHDVVNRVRRIFGEKRVGHAGTLDPAASGVLPVCIGPATRLADYLGEDRKEYRAVIAFGSETSTDDAEGEVVAESDVPAEISDEDFARQYVQSLVGDHSQTPPAFSAIKVQGKRAYDLARKGANVELEPRLVTVYDAELLFVGEDDEAVKWVVYFKVSKGTYIRSLARDIGRNLNSAAHLESLERLSVGRIRIDQCVSLESLEALKTQAALDPVRVLGYRFAFADDMAAKVGNGAVLSRDALTLYEPLDADSYDEPCACSATLCVSNRSARDGETICVIVENRLKALYCFCESDSSWRVKCVLPVGVMRS